MQSATPLSGTGSSMTTPTNRPSNVSPRQYSLAANAAPFENPLITSLVHPASAAAAATMSRASTYDSSGK